MFGFLKKTIKGFVDNFKKEDDTEEKKKVLEAEKSIITPEETTIEKHEDTIEELEKEFKEVEAKEDNKIRIPESLAIDPKETSQEKKIEQKSIPRVPETQDIKEDYNDIEESIILEEKEDKKEKKGFFTKLADSITKRTISEQEFDKMFSELEISLLENNTAYDVVEKIKESLKKEIIKDRVQRSKPHEIIREGLTNAIKELFIPHESFMKKIRSKRPYIIMFLGVNGSGKTTTIAKIAYKIKKEGLMPVLAAGDTFRAAAIQQLEEHAKKIDVRIIKHDYGADPAAVAFDAIKHAESGKADIVLIDTAGRLHSNDNLLKELEKIKRVSKPNLTLFVGEAIAGNDVIEQATVFNEKIGIDGIILTKADVDDKGGAALSVSYVTKAPIYFIGLGQGYEDLKEFTPELIMNALGLE